MSSFDGATLNDLRAMIANADPNGLDAVASKWSAVHEALRQTQEDLLHHTLAATTHWQGAAADAFSARADELHQSLGNGAAYAFNASSGVSCAAEALRNAQAAMPAGPLTLEGISAAQQATAAGVTATQFDEHQRQQAAAVMRQLEKRYAAAEEIIGTPGRAQRFVDHGEFHSSSPTSSASAKMATVQPTIQSKRGRGMLAEQKSRPVDQAAPRNPITTSNLDSTTASHPKQSSQLAPTSLASESGAYDSQESIVTGAPAAGLSRKRLRDEANFPSRSDSLNTPEQRRANIAATDDSPHSDTYRQKFSAPAAYPGRRMDAFDQLSPAGSQVQRKQKIPDFGPAWDYSITPKDANGNNGVASASTTKESQIPTAFGGLAPGSPIKIPKSKGKRPSFLAEDPGTWIPSAKANPPVIE